jgi:hypothetical protein
MPELSSERYEHPPILERGRPARSLGIALFQSLHSIIQRRSIPASVRRAATSIAGIAPLAPAIRSLTVALNPSSRSSSAVWCWYCSHCFIDREVYLSRSLTGSANTGAVWRSSSRGECEPKVQTEIPAQQHDCRCRNRRPKLEPDFSRAPLLIDTSMSTAGHGLRGEPTTIGASSSAVS